MEEKKVDDAFYKALKKTRGSWNGVNPVTKVIPDKKKEKCRRRCRGKIDKCYYQ